MAAKEPDNPAHCCTVSAIVKAKWGGVWQSTKWEGRKKVGRELAVCQRQTLQSSPLCRADALKLRCQKSREGRGRAETDSSGQMEPSLFWSGCWGQDGLRHQVSAWQGRHSSWTDGLLHIHHRICTALLVEALYAAQGQEEPAASGKRPIWIQGPAEAGGDKFICSGSRQGGSQQDSEEDVRPGLPLCCSSVSPCLIP